jgi:hypothetical protein
MNSGRNGNSSAAIQATETTLYLNLNFLKAGNVTFRYNVQGEKGYDGLQFVIDVNIIMQVTALL